MTNIASAVGTEEERKTKWLSSGNKSKKGGKIISAGSSLGQAGRTTIEETQTAAGDGKLNPVNLH